MRKVLLGFVLITLLAACKRSNKEKLTNKWVVIYAYITAPELRDVKDWDKDSLALVVRKIERDYKGQVIDIRNDGSFTSNGNLKNIAGTWQEKSGMVVFTTNDKKEYWDFIGGVVHINHDSTLMTLVRLPGDSACIQLNMKVAHGQPVKTDE